MTLSEMGSMGGFGAEEVPLWLLRGARPIRGVGQLQGTQDRSQDNMERMQFWFGWLCREVKSGGFWVPLESRADGVMRQ